MNSVSVVEAKGTGSVSATAPLKRKISTIPTDLARRRYFPLGCVVVHLISFTVFAHAALTRSYGTLALGGDGGFQFLNAMQQWMWAPFAIGFYSNPFQALGNVWFPSNTKLTPLYVIPALLLQSGGQLHIQPEYVILAYTVGSLELFLSCLVLARSLGQSWPSAIIGAWALPLLVEPFFGYPLLYPILTLTPSVGSMIAQFSLLLASMNELGRQGPRFLNFRLRDPVLAIVIALQIVLLIAFCSTLAVLWGPVLTVMFIGLLLGASKRERQVKLTVVVTIAIALLLLRPAFFLLGLFVFTPTFFSEVLSNTPTTPLMVSIWYGVGETVGPLGPKVFVLGTAGMMLTILFGCRRLRSLASCALSAVGFIIAFGLTTVHWRFWRGPEPVYFEFLIWPLYIIFGVYGAVLLARRLRRATQTLIREAAELEFSRESKSKAFALAVLISSIVPAIFATIHLLPRWFMFLPVVVFAAALLERYLPSSFVDLASKSLRSHGNVF